MTTTEVLTRDSCQGNAARVADDTDPIAKSIRELPLTISRLTELIGCIVNYANDLSRIDRFSDDLGNVQEHLIDSFIASERVRYAGKDGL